MRLRAAAATLGRRVTAPVLSQGICAGSSLLLQVAAARLLGLAGYGSYAVCLSLLVAATALYTGYVGDSLAVLDRQDGATRATLAASALVVLGLAFVVGVGTVLVLTHAWRPALVYSVMLVLWLLEETFRRILIARLEFWRLVVNDATYAVVALAATGAFWLLSGRLTLGWVFAAMGVGAAASVGLGLLQVPAAEYRRLRPGRAAMRAVASFAAWRALHAALRPTALLLSRVLVANLLGLSAVGVLEAGRLVVAPLQTVINGAGSFLLAGFAAAERGGRPAAADGGLARRAALLLTGLTVVGGAVLAALAHPLGRLLTGHPVAPLLVLGWAAYLAVWAAGLPWITEVVARKKSRAVFVARLVDSVLGLGMVVLVLGLGGGLVPVPWLMAVGGLWAVWRICLLAKRTRRAPVPAVVGS